MPLEPGPWRTNQCSLKILFFSNKPQHACNFNLINPVEASRRRYSEPRLKGQTPLFQGDAIVAWWAEWPFNRAQTLSLSITPFDGLHPKTTQSRVPKNRLADKNTKLPEQKNRRQVGCSLCKSAAPFSKTAVFLIRLWFDWFLRISIYFAFQVKLYAYVSVTN